MDTPENSLTCQDPEENSQCPHFNYNITQTGPNRMKATLRVSVGIPAEPEHLLCEQVTFFFSCFSIL